METITKLILPTLQGHSGFSLNVFQKNDKYVFVKRTTENIQRLKKQCEKQRKFYQKVNNSLYIKHLFKVPQVINKVENNNMYSFSMKFYNGRNILSELEYNGYTRLNHILGCLFSFIKWEIKQSILSPLDSEVFKQKAYDIQKKTNNDVSTITEKIIDWSEELDGISIPIGNCHGDFTMSNMIFSDKIILIDFLDSFLESPLQDIGKLLQEVDLRWSLKMRSGKYDALKIKIGYEFLRKKTYEEIEKINLDMRVINLFRLATQARLFPYIKEKKIFEETYENCRSMKKCPIKTRK